jgi:radical SAM superfamily enzyme YgiQ (UPF0313 family)
LNLAILQPAADERARRYPYRDDVAGLAAALRACRHKVGLAVIEACDEGRLSAVVASCRPELVLMYVESLAVDLAVGLAGLLARMHGGPLAAFGPHASLRPDDCLSLPGAEAVVVGPADLALPPYLALRSRSLEHLRTPGLWVKCETGIMRNPPLPAPPSLDREPTVARDAYPFNAVVDPAGFIQVRAARGGEGGASAAAGTPLPMSGWPPTAAWPVLHRPVEAVLDEMRQVADEHFDLVGFRVGGERWAGRPEWLARFAEAYARDIGLPLRTLLFAPDVTPETAALLARAGCEEARLPVGCGSAMVRNDFLGLNFTDDDALAAFAALRRAGVSSVACVEVGVPYETPASLDQTVQFLRRLEPDRVEARLHFPAPGSAADKTARENGWLVPDPAAAYLAGRPALALPRLDPEQIVTACEALPYAVLRPMTARLIRLSRRVKLGKRGTAYDLAVKPFLAPPVRRRKS